MDISKYPIVHPIIFKQSPIISKIADEPNWTVSNDKKVPINAKALLHSGMVYNAKFDGESPLVSLNDLDSDPNLDVVNRTYRMKSRENRIIVIDVEPEAADSVKQSALMFPAHLTELSTNGGVHLVIEVPESLINDNNRYMFDGLSVFKEPVPENESRKSGYEVLFNDHFLTFTKRVVTDKESADFENDNTARNLLKGFIDTIVAQDKERKKEREIAKQYRIDMIEERLDEDKLKVIKKFMDLSAFNNAKENNIGKTVDDFNEDHSIYEISIANSYAYHTIDVYEMASKTRSYKELTDKLTEQDLVYIIYMFLDETITYRPKHDEDRDDLPWLLFTAKKAYEYIKAKNN